MPNRILEDVLYTTDKFIDSHFEYPVEQEILLADYDQQIFKIVKTLTHHTITQKYVNGNKLVLEGFFRISVFYQPPAGANLTVISKKIPFNKQLDLPRAVTSPYFIAITGESRYVNTRAINPTRIDVRGVYNFSVKGFTQNRLSVTTAVNSPDVCTDAEEISHFALCGSGNRQFSLEEDLDLGPQADKILDISARMGEMTITAYNDKVNVKGEVSAQILYTTTDTQQLHKDFKTFSYNQVVDVTGCTDNTACYGSIQPVSFTVTQNPDTQATSCIFTANIDVQAFRKMSLIAITDGFSKRYEYTAEKQSLEWDANIHTVNKNMSVIIEDGVVQGYEPCRCFADITTPVVTTGENSPALKSKITVNVVVKNSAGEYECFSKTEDFYFHTDENPENNEFIIAPHITSANATISGDNMKVKVDLNLSGFELVRSRTDILCQFDENREKLRLKRENALVLYYAQKGEKLFDIAMRYKTDVHTIARQNSIDTKLLAEDKMLFIPAYDM